MSEINKTIERIVELMVIRQNLEAAVLMQEITREEADEIMNCVLNAER